MSNLIPIKLAEQAMAVRDEEIAKLKAEVERLREAGDAMADCLNPCGARDNWNAAKEGKRS